MPYWHSILPAGNHRCLSRPPWLWKKLRLKITNAFPSFCYGKYEVRKAFAGHADLLDQACLSCPYCSWWVSLRAQLWAVHPIQDVQPFSEQSRASATRQHPAQHSHLQKTTYRWQKHCRAPGHHWGLHPGGSLGVLLEISTCSTLPAVLPTLATSATADTSHEMMCNKQKWVLWSHQGINTQTHPQPCKRQCHQPGEAAHARGVPPTGRYLHWTHLAPAHRGVLAQSIGLAAVYWALTNSRGTELLCQEPRAGRWCEQSPYTAMGCKFRWLTDEFGQNSY